MSISIAAKNAAVDAITGLITHLDLLDVHVVEAIRHRLILGRGAGIRILEFGEVDVSDWMCRHSFVPFSARLVRLSLSTVFAATYSSAEVPPPFPFSNA